MLARNLLGIRFPFLRGGPAVGIDPLSSGGLPDKLFLPPQDQKLKAFAGGRLRVQTGGESEMRNGADRLFDLSRLFGIRGLLDL